MDKKERTQQKRNKESGYRLETKVSRIAEQFGFPSRRAPVSNGENLGYHAQVDNVIDFAPEVESIPAKTVQAKKRRVITSVIKPSTYNVDMVVAEAYRDEPLMIMEFRKFCHFIASLSVETSTSDRGGYPEGIYELLSIILDNYAQHIDTPMYKCLDAIRDAAYRAKETGEHDSFVKKIEEFSL